MDSEYIDIHSHLYSPDFDADREEEIAKLKENKIAMITVGTDFESSQKAIALAEKYSHIFATVGLHPGSVSKDISYDISKDYEILANNRKVVAVGECGLDYYREAAADAHLQKIQKQIFEAHIDLALKKNLPLMLHIRPTKGSMNAYLDALEILESRVQGLTLHKNKLRGNVHFFVGDLDILKRFLDIGFTVSFTGVITFASDYDELVKYVPLDMVMAETDAPLVAPLPYRGQRNSPLYVSEVVKKIAEIRNEDFDTIRIQLMANAKQVFKIG